MDQNWCIDNQVLAIEYFKERQSEHSHWENGLNNLRKNKKELDDLYWQFKGLIAKFNNYYSEAVSTKSDLETLEEQRNKGAITQELFLQRESQIRTKLTQSFQNLIETHEEIKNKIPTISREGEINELNISAQELYDKGKYDQSVDKWNVVLNIDPMNQTAIEGVKKAKKDTIDIGGERTLPPRTKVLDVKKLWPKGTKSKIIAALLIFVGLVFLILLISPSSAPITSDYLIGTWSGKTSGWTETLVFVSDGTFEDLYTHPKTSNTTYLSGSYKLTDSELKLTYSGGKYYTYPLDYQDQNRFGMDNVVYTRTQANEIPPDYLIGTWSGKISDLTYTYIFVSDGTFEDVDTNLKTSNTTYYNGSYQLTDSKITLTYSDGSYISYSLDYQNLNRFGMDNIVYTRIQANEIPPDYFIGTWSGKTSDWTETLVFVSDGTFEDTIAHTKTSNTTYLSGSYKLTDSELKLTYSDGSYYTYTLDYQDMNRFGMDNVVYTRINE
jgi:hypothetical protein